MEHDAILEPPDPEGPGSGVWDESFLPPVPDVVDLVLEAAALEGVFAVQRLVRVDGMRRELLVEAEGRGAGVREIVERSIRLELAAAMRITEHTAGRMIGHADALVHRYPTVLDSLAGGRITLKHAELLADGIDELEPGLREDAAAQALLLAEAEPVGTFRRALHRLVETVQAVTLEERYAAAVRTRRVILEPGVDGMGALLLFAPMVELHAIHGRVTAIGKTITGGDGDDRTLDQVRADVVCDLLIDGTTDQTPTKARGIRASVVVTVPVLSLLDDPAAATAGAGGDRTAGVTGTGNAGGAADEADDGGGTARAGGATGPGATADLPVVEGVGPIPLSKARELCGGEAKWMRVLTHPETGMVLSVGRDTYEPPPALRRLVKWRADRCMGPGCTMPASRCEVDHQIAWADGGHTCLENNCPFCKGHHLVKHHGGWHVRQIEGSGGAVEWTSPTGRRYIVHPERRVPVFTVARSDQGTPPF